MSNGRRPKQLALSMPHEPALGRADFLVGEANADATSFIDAWPDWPASVVLLIGPPGSGKSHLARAFAERSGAPIIQAADLAGRDPTRLVGRGAVAVEDADDPTLDEVALFHLLNAARGRGASVLVTARVIPADWGLTLPDLESRLRAAQPACLGPPDDELLRRVLVKLFADRQIEVDAGVLDVLLTRMERSFAAAGRIVDALDRESLARGRKVTRAMASEIVAPPSDDD
ncbi:MAG TPA: AAA family ATPase [Methylomirabilota bacterium]|nr:AAA family ATPase [Methylomirabilota bacterium]